MKNFFWKKCSHTLEESTIYTDYFETIVHSYNKISILIPNNFLDFSKNPIPWLVSVLVETETGQGTGNCMPHHLS